MSNQFLRVGMIIEEVSGVTRKFESREQHAEFWANQPKTTAPQFEVAKVSGKSVEVKVKLPK